MKAGTETGMGVLMGTDREPTTPARTRITTDTIQSTDVEAIRTGVVGCEAEMEVVMVMVTLESETGSGIIILLEGKEAELICD